MRFIVDNHSTASDVTALRLVAEQAEYILAQPGRRLTMIASYGWKRLRIVYRRNWITTTFRVEDAKG